MRRDRAGGRQVRAMILNGRLTPGQPLPPSRELAARLAISRNTVGVAYDRLAAEGFVAGRVGAGTFVNAALRPARPEATAEPAEPVRPRPPWNALRVGADLSATTAEYDLRAGMPDPGSSRTRPGAG